MQSLIVFLEKNPHYIFLSTTDILKSSCVNRERGLQVKHLQHNLDNLSSIPWTMKKCQIHWNVSANPDSKGGRERKMPWRLDDQLAWCTQQKRNNRNPPSNKVEGKKWQSRLSSTWLLSHMSTFHTEICTHRYTLYIRKHKNLKKKT